MREGPSVPNVETELADLFAADQKDREDRLSEKDPAMFLARDRARMARARQIFELRKTAVITPEGLYHLAMLFQHGHNSDDYLKAWQLAEESEKAGHIFGGELAAAAEDRYLLSVGKKQKWGTQFRKEEKGKTVLLDMLPDAESGVTDEMRTARGVMSRSEMLEFLRQEETKDK
jgi:hypothetical protein